MSIIEFPILSGAYLRSLRPRLIQIKHEYAKGILALWEYLRPKTISRSEKPLFGAKKRGAPSGCPGA
jgi:hypothetical protein